MHFFLILLVHSIQSPKVIHSKRLPSKIVVRKGEKKEKEVNIVMTLIEELVINWLKIIFKGFDKS